MGHYAGVLVTGGEMAAVGKMAEVVGEGTRRGREDQRRSSAPRRRDGRDGGRLPDIAASDLGGILTSSSLTQPRLASSGRPALDHVSGETGGAVGR